MKNSTLFVFFLNIFFATVACAQIDKGSVKNNKEHSTSHEVGFNSIATLKQILNFSNNNTSAESPYMAMYKLGLGKHYFRFSLGGNQSQKLEQIEGFLDSKTLRKIDLYSRLGYERQKQASKRIRLSYGIDAVYEMHDVTSIQDSGLDKAFSIENEKAFGGGPFLGFNFQFNKHFAIYTESALYYTYSIGIKQKDFTNNPDFKDTENASYSSKTSFLPPTALFLLYKF